MDEDKLIEQFLEEIEEILTTYSVEASGAHYVFSDDALSRYDGIRLGYRWDSWRVVHSFVKFDIDIPDNVEIKSQKFYLGVHSYYYGGFSGRSESFKIGARIVKQEGFNWPNFNWNRKNTGTSTDWGASDPAHTHTNDTSNLIGDAHWYVNSDIVIFDNTYFEGKDIEIDLESGTYYVVFYIYDLNNVDNEHYISASLDNYPPKIEITYKENYYSGVSHEAPSKDIWRHKGMMPVLFNGNLRFTPFFEQIED